METQPINDEPLRTFEWNSAVGPAIAAISAIAEERDLDPREVPSLHSAIDTEALNSLFTTEYQEQRSASRTVQFEFQGYRITIESTGHGYLYDSSS